MRKSQFWNWMDIKLLNVACSLFSAAAVCTLKWWIVNLLRNKEESFDLIPCAFECKRSKDIWKLQSENTHTVESAVHGTSKQY